MRFNLWIPSLFCEKGGIQVYSAYLFQALRAHHPAHQYQIFLKHDLPEAIPSPPATIEFHTAGQSPTPFQTIQFILQLLKPHIQSPPNLIISTHLNFTIVAYLLKSIKGIPYWTIAHGIEAWNIQKPLLKLALQNADRILAVSHYTRDRLLKEQNLDPNKIVVLPNTFDSDRFTITPKPQNLLDRYHLTPNQPIILTVARLSKSEQYKGYDQILRALPTIRQQIPNIHYILVGKGDDRDRIEKLISDLELQNCVTLAGYIHDDELASHYNLCDVFAMPSKGEGFGIVYLEALACGKPTLGGNQDGAIDALCHGTLGALVNPDNPEEIAQTLIQILQGTYPNPLMYQPEQLRQKVIETYGFEKFKQTLANYLTQSGLGDPTQSKLSSQ